MNTPNLAAVEKRTWHTPKGYILKSSTTYMSADLPGCKRVSPTECWWSDVATKDDWDPRGPS